MIKEKKAVRKNIYIPVTSKPVGSMAKDEIERDLALEVKFKFADMEESERIIAKNAVEEYIYAIREKVPDSDTVSFIFFISTSTNPIFKLPLDSYYIRIY